MSLLALFRPRKQSSGGLVTINANIGIWTWAGIAASIAVTIGAGTGNYTWQGVKASVPTLFQTSVGTYTWQGQKASIASLINANVGTYTWQGITSELVVTTTLNASTGNYAWSGQKAQFDAGIIDLGQVSGGVRKKKPLTIKLSDLKERPEYEKQLRWTVEQAKIEREQAKPPKIVKYVAQKYYTQQSVSNEVSRETLLKIQNAKDEEEIIALLPTILRLL